MSNNLHTSQVSLSDDSSATFLIRWRGRQEGPYTAAIVEAKLVANQIGLLHEIYHNSQWVTLRDYFAERVVRRAERWASEENERRAREEAEIRARTVEESKRQQEEQLGSVLETMERQKNTLLEKAVMTAIKPKSPKWAWFCLGVSTFFWFSSGAWLNSANEEWRAFAQTRDEISREMGSSSYQKEKLAEAIVLALLGEDPYRALDQPLSTLKRTGVEAERIRSNIQTARLATRSWLLISALFGGLAIWRHWVYRNTLQSLGYLPVSSHSPSPPSVM